MEVYLLEIKMANCCLLKIQVLMILLFAISRIALKVMIFLLILHLNYLICFISIFTLNLPFTFTLTHNFLFTKGFLISSLLLVYIYFQYSQDILRSNFSFDLNWYWYWLSSKLRFLIYQFSHLILQISFSKSIILFHLLFFLIFLLLPFFLLLLILLLFFINVSIR